MPTDHHARQHAVDDIVVTDNDFADFIFDLVVPLAKLFGLLFKRVVVAHGVVRLSIWGLSLIHI